MACDIIVRHCTTHVWKSCTFFWTLFADLEQNQWQLLFTSPEAVVEDSRLKEIIQRNRKDIKYIGFDEVHTLVEWCVNGNINRTLTCKAVKYPYCVKFSQNLMKPLRITKIKKHRSVRVWTPTGWTRLVSHKWHKKWN